MFITKNRFQGICGALLILLGTVAVASAVFITPTFAANYLSADHDLSLDGINQLNTYRFVSAIAGLLSCLAGLVLVSVKNPETKLQGVMDFFQFGPSEENKSKNAERLFVAAFMGLVGISGFLFLLWITPYGAGVSPDSTTFIRAAKSLLAGKGYSLNGAPLTHYPPLYPIFLAASGLFQNDMVQAARMLCAFLFGINAALIALAVYLSAGRNFLTSTFAVLFFYSSAPLIELHAMAWSEPLFISLCLASIVLLCLYVVRPTLILLVASSVLLGCALITRYVGIAFIPAPLLIVFFSVRNQRFGRRLWNSLIYLALTCAPLCILFVRNLMVAGSATNRSVVFHPASVSHFLAGMSATVTNFIAPISVPNGIKLAVFVLIAVALISPILTLLRRHLEDMNWRSMGIVMAISCLLFSASYVLFLYVSISSVDALTPPDARILSPILILLILGAFSAFWTISQTLKKQLLWMGFLILVVCSISLKTAEAVKSTGAIRENGLEYTSRQWQGLEVVAFVKTLPDNVTIYSNGEDVLDFLAEKPARSIPRKSDFTSMKANPLYGAEMETMCREIVSNGAILVYLNQITWRFYLPTQEELMARCNLPVIRSFSDGTVFGTVSK